jgi:hypothetical protein
VALFVLDARQVALDQAAEGLVADLDERVDRPAQVAIGLGRRPSMIWARANC